MSDNTPDTRKKPPSDWLGEVRDRAVEWIDRWINPPVPVPVPVPVRVRRR